MAASYENSDSATARLLRLILTARSFAGHGIDQHTGWSRLFGVSVSDKPALFQGIGAFISLVAEARQEVASLQNVDLNLFIETFDELNPLLNNITLNQGHDWQSIFGPNTLHNATIRGLRHAADAVWRTKPTRLQPDDLNSLRAELDRLETLVQASPPELSVALHKCLSLFRVALNHYEVYGNAGLQRAVEQAIGILFCLGEPTLVENADDEGKTGVWEYIKRLNAVIAIAKNAPEVLAMGLELVRPLLPGGKP